MKSTALPVLAIMIASTLPTLLPAATRPGILWNNRWQPWGRAALTAIAANPAGEMVAVGGNVILHSTDGTHWSQTNNRSGLAFQDVTWSGGEWIIVGLNGTIMSSPDAVTWTHHSLGPLGHRSLGAVVAHPAGTIIPCNGITAGSNAPGSWATFSNDFSILDETPHDLHIFTPPSFTLPFIIATVTRGGGIYASLGAGTWILQKPAEPAESFFAVSGNDSILVAGAVAPADLGVGTRFYTSADSVTWTKRTIPGLTAPFLDIIWTGSSFIACGKDFDTSSPVVFTSPDGISWAHHAPSGPISRLCWNGSMIVGISSQGTLHICADPSPDETSDWGIPPVSLVRKNVWGLADTEIGGTPWVVAVGDYGLIMTSDNWGYSFNQLSAPTSAKLRDVIATGLTDHRFIAFGNELIVTSPDAATWTVQSGPGTPDANGGDWFSPTSLTDPRLAVAVGSLGRIWTSPDGTSWTARSSGTAGDLYDVGSGWAIGPKPGLVRSKRLVAVGVGGTIVTSSSGTTWTVRSSGTIKPLRDVCGIDQGFIACGDGGTLLRSINGIDWSPANLPEPLDSTDNLHSCVWTGSHAIVTGTNLVLSSPDGFNWSMQRSLVGTPYALAHLANDRVLTGGAGGIFSSDPALDYADWAAFVGLPAGEDDPKDDPNGDGHNNLIAYAFNLEPLLTPDPESITALPRSASRPAESTFRLRLSPGNGAIGDLTYIVETSHLLTPGSWIEMMRYHPGDLRPTGLLHLSETEDADHIEIEFPESLLYPPPFFARLRLELDP